MYKYILFDLDGTLTDSAEGVTKSVQFALAQNGIEEPDLKKLYKFLGPPLTASFMEHYGFSEEKALAAVWDFRKRYEPIGILENKLYPGIKELLSDLKDKGCRLIVASSKPEFQVYRVLDNFGIREYFDVIAGAPADERAYSKEDVMATALRELMGIIDGNSPSVSEPNETFVPEADREGSDLEEEMDRHGINKITCAMVGDRLYDIRAAIELGVTPVGVSYGYAPKGELEEAGADLIARDTKHLKKILLGDSSKVDKKKQLFPGYSIKVPFLRIIVISITLSLGLNVFFNLIDFVSKSEAFAKVAEVQMNVTVLTGLLLFAILAPLLEEVIFRLLIFRTLRRFLDPRAAIVISAVLFGAYHGNMVQGVYAGLMGAIFAYVYNCTGRLYIAMLMHGVSNLSVFIFARDESIFGTILTPIHCVIFMVIGLTSLYRFHRTYYPSRG